MPDIDVDDLGSIGLIQDEKPYKIPPEAFSTAFNMRVEDGRMVTVGGRTQAMGTPSVAPYFLLPVRGPSETLYWIYTSLTKAYVYTAAAHSDITNAGGDYTATYARDWNATIHGGVPIINSGSDNLQFWSAFSASQKLTDLTNWTSGDTAKFVRSFGPFLVCGNVTLSATAYAHGVLWSHPADPGSVPSSWDYSDETKDAGLYELPDAESGVLIDGRMLRGQMYLYKASATWVMRHIGGRLIFSFTNFLETSGILAPRCVASTGDGRWHLVATQDDLIIHDGQQVLSVVEGKLRRTIFAAIDSTNYRESFVFSIPGRKEIWFCYPETGSSTPTRALIWNYGAGGERGVVTETEVNFVAAATGDAELQSADTWASVSGTWASYTGGAWSSADTRKTFVAQGATATKILELDKGTTFDGSAITATLARESLGIIGRKRDNSPVVDFSVVKFVRRVWIVGSGGPINVRIGVQDTVEGSVVWSDSQAFDPTTDMFVDFTSTGVAVSIEFSAAVPFEISSYKLVMAIAGRFG